MSYIKDIVEKVLPVDIGEEFNIILDDGRYCMHNPFKFTETDLVDTHGGVLNSYISILITGEYKIEKIPFTPKMGEKYWTNTTNLGTKNEWVRTFDRDYVSGRSGWKLRDSYPVRAVRSN